jgi:hypothetical protein
MWHDAIGYAIQAGIGLALLYIGHKLNAAERGIEEVHILVNSKMADALSEIARLNVALSVASEEKGKHDAAN